MHPLCLYASETNIVSKVQGWSLVTQGQREQSGRGKMTPQK